MSMTCVSSAEHMLIITPLRLEKIPHAFIKLMDKPYFQKKENLYRLIPISNSFQNLDYFKLFVKYKKKLTLNSRRHLKNKSFSKTPDPLDWKQILANHYFLNQNCSIFPKPPT